MMNHLSRLAERKKGLLFVLCLSLAIKIALALFIKVINPDGDEYILAAQQFASGHFKEGLALTPIPFYPFLITVVHFAVPHWVAAARVVSIASLVLALIPLYLLTTELFNRRAAFWACLAFAIAPFPNECALEVIRGGTYLLFFAWAVYVAQRALGSPRPILFLGAVAFTWVALLFRIEGIIVVPFFLFFLLGLSVVKPAERGPFFKGMLIWVACPLLPLLALLAILGPELSQLTGNVSHNLQGLLDFKFLHSYEAVRDQLKAMEAASPFPGGKENFAEIARRFMPLIYLLGLLHGYIKVLFPLFVIPLFWGFRHTLDRRRVFVLGLTLCYLLVLYHRLIERDFIQGRFMLAPAFLLYPWIGSGMERIFTALKKWPGAGAITLLFVIAFAGPPLYKSAQMTWKQDSVVALAGEWLAAKPAFQKAAILSNDSRIPFYAGRKTDFKMYKKRHHGHDYGAMEEIALSKRMDLIIIRTAMKKRGALPQFKQFKKIKEFRGRKNLAVIYGSPQFRKGLGK